MGHNGSWIPRNGSEPRNTSGAEAAGANRTAPGELGEAQLYRQFTTTVQVVIFVGSLLGKPRRGARGAGAWHGAGTGGGENAGVTAVELSGDGRLQPRGWKCSSHPAHPDGGGCVVPARSVFPEGLCGAPRAFLTSPVPGHSAGLAR